MKKEKKKSVLTRIIPYAGKRKYMLFLAMAFSALSGILLLMPMWYIHNIIKNVILNGNVNYTMIRVHCRAIMQSTKRIFMSYSKRTKR